MSKFGIAALAVALGMAVPAAPAAARPAGEGPAPVTRQHVATVKGTKLPYAASFERFAIASPRGPSGATITTIAYVKDKPDPKRPVVFAFNGGPGSASIFLNVGLLGPRRVELPGDPAAAVPAQVPLVANEETLLSDADIVLIDPVGTGFSKLIDPEAASYFYSVRGDAQSVADAIAAWTRAHGREASPKYVLGESYGAVRAIFVAADMLKQPVTANLDGVVVISQSLQIVDTVQRRSNIVGQVAGMPTLAVSAWYHKLAGQGQKLEAFVGAASAFARQEWLPALMAGSTLDPATRRRVAEGLTRFTGVPTDYFLSHDLYLTKEEYRRLALAGRGQMLGLYDTRYVGPLAARRDPDGVLVDAITAAGNVMWRDQLGIDVAAFAGTGRDSLRRLGSNWIYVTQPFAPTAGPNYRQIDYVADVLQLMADKPALRLMVACGWYDTAASAGADDYFLSRPGLDHARIETARYPAGHMFYTDAASRIAFAARLRSFVAAH